MLRLVLFDFLTLEFRRPKLIGPDLKKLVLNCGQEAQPKWLDSLKVSCAVFTSELQL